MASHLPQFDDAARFQQPAPYHSSTHLVGYSLRDDPDSKSSYFEDDLEEADTTQGYYPHSNANRRKSQIVYDNSPPPVYPPMRKASTASSIDVSDIIESYEEDPGPSEIRDRKPDVPPNTPKSSVWRSFIPSSLACRLYLLVALLETFIDVAIEVELFVRVRNAANASNQPDEAADYARLPVYIFLFGLAHAFQFLLAVDAVRSRNMLQIAFLAVFNGVFIGYSVLQITEVKSALPPDTPGIVSIPIGIVLLLIPIVISVAQVAYLLLSWKLHTEFGWQVYKLLGADRQIKKMFLYYQVFECLLKFDVYFWIGFSVQFIFLTLDNTDIEYPLTIAALPISLLLLIEGHLAARFENRWLMGSFMVGSLAVCVYFAYKLVRILTERTDDRFASVWKSLVVFSSASIALLLVTFVFACIVFSNFGRGLKRHLRKSKRALDTPSTRRVNGDANFRNPNRMSIE